MQHGQPLIKTATCFGRVQAISRIHTKTDANRLRCPGPRVSLGTRLKAGSSVA
jgi:hypothetical protein